MHRRRIGSATIVLAVLVALTAALALASAAAAAPSSGEALFYPCTACHPVIKGSSAKLPNGFQGHRIELVGHDALGAGSTACTACHDAAERNPGKLRRADGGFVDITGDVTQVCYRCHSDKHAEWVAGVHGKRKPKCTSAGCHDPHAPGSIYAGPLGPFVGTGFTVRVLPERTAFKALAAPAAAPPVETPAWLVAMAVLGALAASAAAGSVAIERSR